MEKPFLSYLKTFREEVCIKSCVGGAHKPFLHAVTVNKDEGSSIVANATLIHVQKAPKTQPDNSSRHA